MTWPPRLVQGCQKGTPGGDFGGKGGNTYVPPFPLQRQRKARPESGFGSTPEIWPHAKNEDSCTVWRHFGFLASDSRDPFCVYYQHGLQMAPKASQKVPQEVILEGKGGIPKVGRSPPAPTQEQFWIHSGLLILTTVSAFCLFLSDSRGSG